MLVDTDVLIWFTRGHFAALERLQTVLPWQISAVTYIELMQGCRNTNEMRAIKLGLKHVGASVLPVTERISERAMVLIEWYALSHGMRLGDALIAATALENSLTLLSANRKHFAPVAGLRLEVFEP